MAENPSEIKTDISVSTPDVRAFGIPPELLRGITITADDLAAFGTDETPDTSTVPVADALDIPEYKAIQHPDLVAKYRVFQDMLHPEVGVVYHPCSAYDSSPSVAFPGSRVIYAEWGAHGANERQAQSNVQALQKAGLEAHFADARTFDPGPVDVLILLNGIGPLSPDGQEGPATHIKPGGYALVDDRFGAASQLHERDDFALVGILHNRTPSRQPVLDTDAPQAHWETVETDEEFRSSADYPGLAHMIEPETGTDEPSLEQYRQALQRVSAYPGAIEDGGIIVYGPTHQLFPATPGRKKGRPSDFYVFQRKPTEDSHPV